ncbi:MAG: hypothetical protein H0Z28_02360 [Archaeoglobus sp.]|nr:hypothetical protein [Archaeoglobus sp.]
MSEIMSKPYKINKNALRQLVEARMYSKIASAERKKRTATTLISFLYGSEPFVFYAAEALGTICGVLEKENESEFVREILRRLFWHLRDESGAYCKGAPLAIGEIGRNAPIAFEGFKNMLLSLLRNEEVELRYVIYGISRAAMHMLDAYPNPIEELLPFLQHEDPAIRGYAAIALCKLGAKLEKDHFKGDEEFEIYFEGKILKTNLERLKALISDCFDY